MTSSTEVWNTKFVQALNELETIGKNKGEVFRHEHTRLRRYNISSTI